MKIRSLLLGLSLIAGFGLSSTIAQDASDALTRFDKKPVPTRTPPPSLPASLEGASGMVLVSIVIDEKGDVAEATVAKSTHSGFDAPALAALKNWKFRPAEKDGQPVKVRIQVPVQFNS